MMAAHARIAKRHRANLNWLAANLRFTLLLDEVGRKIEPAYRLKERWLQGEIDSQALAQRLPQCRREQESAPVKELFQTYASRVRSRGELGELSSLNQKLWLEYLERRRFPEYNLRRPQAKKENCGYDALGKARCP